MKCGRQVNEDAVTAWLNSVNKKVPCNKCHGSGIWMGEYDSDNCTRCDGTGRVPAKVEPK